MKAKVLFSMLLFAAASCVGDTVNYTYDNAGRLVRIDYSSGSAITYTYDPAGNLLSRSVKTASDATPSGSAIPSTRATETRGASKRRARRPRQSDATAASTDSSPAAKR